VRKGSGAQRQREDFALEFSFGLESSFLPPISLALSLVLILMQIYDIDMICNQYMNLMMSAGKAERGLDGGNVESVTKDMDFMSLVDVDGKMLTIVELEAVRNAGRCMRYWNGWRRSGNRSWGSFFRRAWRVEYSI
jgi:hypothetical protein